MKVVAIAAVALLGCGKPSIDRVAARKLFDEIEVATPPGMSDITVDDRGVLWGIAERDRQVVELSLDGKAPVLHAIEGVPDHLDTEALAALGHGRFAIGTEGAKQPSAAILFAERKGDALVVTGGKPLSNADVGVTLTTNHGIEALCGREGELLVAIETVGTMPDGRRWAPLLRVRGDDLHLTKLWLTSTKGKISALTCTIADDGVAQVAAIERHYGVSRILTFSVGRDDTEVTPTVMLDMAAVLKDTFNMEGIAKLPDGRFVLINDNQGSRVDGPTELFVLHSR